MYNVKKFAQQMDSVTYCDISFFEVLRFIEIKFPSIGYF